MILLDNYVFITLIFYKNNFIRKRGSFLLKIKEQIKKNPASAKEQKFQIFS